MLMQRIIVNLFGRQELKVVKQLERFEKLSYDQISESRLRKLNQLITHFRTYPFYRDLMKQCGSPETLTHIDNLKRFPVITKDVIRSNLDYIAQRPESVYLNSTSGSTGTNFKFYQSKEMLIWRRAANIVHCSWMGVNYWRDRKVTVWGLSPKIKHVREWLQKVKVFVQGGKLYQAYGLDEGRCVEILDDMRDFSPASMTCYPTYGYALAQAGEKGGVKSPGLKAIIVSGETCFEHQKEKMQNYFGCKVYNRYGSREFGSIAHEDERQKGLLIHPARLYVETDQDGEMLVTDLNNFATPFIRYAIGDSGVICHRNEGSGKTAFDSIQNLSGRSHDMIRTKSGKQLPGQFWTTLSRSVPGIDAFQLVQKDKEHIELRAKVNSEYKDANEDKLHQKLKLVAGDEVKLTVVKVKEIEKTPAGKRRFIIR